MTRHDMTRRNGTSFNGALFHAFAPLNGLTGRAEGGRAGGRTPFCGYDQIHSGRTDRTTDRPLRGGLLCSSLLFSLAFGRCDLPSEAATARRRSLRSVIISDCRCQRDRRITLAEESAQSMPHRMKALSSPFLRFLLRFSSPSRKGNRMKSGRTDATCYICPTDMT